MRYKPHGLQENVLAGSTQYVLVNPCSLSHTTLF